MGYKIYQINREWKKDLGQEWRQHTLSDIQFGFDIDEDYLDKNWENEFFNAYKNVVNVDLSSKEDDLWDLYRILNLHEHEVYVAGSGKLEDRYEDIISNYETKEIERDGKTFEMRMFHSLSIGDIVYDEEAEKYFLLGDTFIDITDRVNALREVA